MPIQLPATGFVGLTSGGSEVTGNNYAREAASFNLTASGDTVANIDGIVWDSAYPGGWGLIDGVLVFNELGELIATAIPVHSVTVGPYEAARIRPGQLVIGPGPSVGSPYGRHRYGRGRYATQPTFLAWVDLIEIGFDRTDPCVPGVWDPAHACGDAAWAVLDPCTTAAWAPLRAGEQVAWDPINACTPGTWSRP